MNECNSFIETSIVYGSSISDLNLYICMNKALSLCLIFMFDLYLWSLCLIFMFDLWSLSLSLVFINILCLICEYVKWRSIFLNVLKWLVFCNNFGYNRRVLSHNLQSVFCFWDIVTLDKGGASAVVQIFCGYISRAFHDNAQSLVLQ